MFSEDAKWFSFISNHFLNGISQYTFTMEYDSTTTVRDPPEIECVQCLQYILMPQCKYGVKGTKKFAISICCQT